MLGDNIGAGRQSARDVLRERAEGLRRGAEIMNLKAAALDVLAEEIAGLSGAAESALWSALWERGVSQNPTTPPSILC